MEDIKEQLRFRFFCTIFGLSFCPLSVDGNEEKIAVSVREVETDAISGAIFFEEFIVQFFDLGIAENLDFDNGVFDFEMPADA